MPRKKTSQHGAANRIQTAASSYAANDTPSNTNPNNSQIDQVTTEKQVAKRSNDVSLEKIAPIPAKRSRKQTTRFNPTAMISDRIQSTVINTDINDHWEEEVINSKTICSPLSSADSKLTQMLKTMEEGYKNRIEALERKLESQHAVLQSQHRLVTNSKPMETTNLTISKTLNENEFVEQPKAVTTKTSKPMCPKYTTPPFSGILKDDKIDFDTWVAKSKRFLVDWDVPEATKINATLMNISGPAIEILQARESEIKTVNDVYELLKPHFQIIDKFRKLESIRQEGQGEESIQVLGAKIRALCDASCTPETRESRALKYFVNALRPELHKKVSTAAPVTLDIAMTQAKNFEEGLLKTAPRTAIQLAQVRQQAADNEAQTDDSMYSSTASSGELSHKQYEAIRKHLSSLSREHKDDIERIERSVNNLANQSQPFEPNFRKSYGNNRQFNLSSSPTFGEGCFHCGKSNHSFMKCFKATDEDKKRISKAFADRKRQQAHSNDTRLKAKSAKNASSSHGTQHN